MSNNTTVPNDKPSLIEELSSVLQEFKRKLEAMDDPEWSLRFLEVFMNNQEFYNVAVKDPKNLKMLPAMFEILREYVLKQGPYNCRSVESMFNDNPNLPEAYRLYKKQYRIGSKTHLSKVKATPKSNSKKLTFFDSFIELSVYLCALGRCRLRFHTENEKCIVDIPHGDLSGDLYEEYYMFYNRSLMDNGVGIGKIAITDSIHANLEFYYSSGSGKSRSSPGKFRILSTSAQARLYGPPSDILIIKNLLPGKGLEKDEKPEYAEGFFVIKKYGGKTEKILLGIHCSWNRDRHFPFSTAVVLVEKHYYDENHDVTHDYAFDKIKESRNQDVTTRDRLIPPSIYYYLFQQTINLDAVISTHLNDFKKQAPFVKLTEMPFYGEESQYLPVLEGRYKGCTIINDAQKDYAVITQLKIFRNGMVHFTIDENGIIDSPKKDPLQNFGFVRYIAPPVNARGKIFISLRYNNPKHVNTMNMILEFDADVQSGNNNKTLFLRGGLAGDSQITHRPLAVTLVFERISKDSTVKLGKISITDTANKLTTEIIKAYRSNRDLFNFFVTDDAANYSNHPKISMLIQKLSGDKVKINTAGNNDQYDVFISIPLLHNDSIIEYKKNAKLALMLVNLLQKKMGFSRKRIFTACVNTQKNEIFTYEQYLSVFDQPRRIFEEIREKLDSSRYSFFIYPDPPPGIKKTSRISSSVLELGYSLGLGKKVIIFCDQIERKNLPATIIKLYEDQIFIFDSKNKMPFHKTFSNELESIKEQLKS